MVSDFRFPTMLKDSFLYSVKAGLFASLASTFGRLSLNNTDAESICSNLLGERELLATAYFCDKVCCYCQCGKNKNLHV